MPREIFEPGSGDLLLTSVMFWVYLFSRSQGPEAWPLVLINLTIGRSCAVPLYLYFITPRTEQASVTA